ncbi:hypothetical protein BaOVIS_024640 [Babesia ovis]|uniref:Uncharacterized protein n=1 Tax=Babesia ovis TaxID=5869 RepID=A0A9W5TBS9_BABOV|nr:hypothetical protein BaOVIS_024640 [Babesia ovis]
MYRQWLLRHNRVIWAQVTAAGARGVPGRQLLALTSLRGFSGQPSTFQQHISRAKGALAHTSQTPSYVYSETMKEHIKAIRKEADQLENKEASTIADHLCKGAEEYHNTLLKYLKNRDEYNQAAQTRITNESNIKYGIMGVSFMCVFGSLALSLHPMFLLGCAIGGYVYRPVFRQSRMRREITNNMGNYLAISKQYKQQMAQLQQDIETDLSQLEQCYIKEY